MIRLAIPAIALAAGLLIPAWAEAAVQPRTLAVVDGEQVTLGDLFEDAGKAASVAVGRAPAEGKSITLDAAFLGRIASLHRLDWAPQTGEEQVVVSRSAPAAPAAPVANLELAAAVIGAAPAVTIPVQPAAVQPAAVEVPAPAPAPVAAPVAAEAPAPARRSHRREAPVVEMVEVAVLRDRMDRGGLIQPEDVELVAMDKRKLRGVEPLTEADIVGQSPRRLISPGRPLVAGDVGAPISVTKGSPVMLRLATGTMVLTVQGKAMQDGADGETIKVLNVSSNRQIEGRVENSGLVSVQAATSALN